MTSNGENVCDLRELLSLVTSDRFNKTQSHRVASKIPEKCLNEPCILGVDEAGRGPVLGPMVYCVCYCPLSDVEILKTVGCADSKALTENKREEIFSAINNNNDCIGWAVDIISPNLISNKMLKKTKYSLNEIAQNSTIKLIESILERNIEISEIYVDTIGPPDKYQMLRLRFEVFSMSDPVDKWKIQKASEINATLRLSTGSSNLDKCFSGGLPTNGITEICGQSGSGKSQLCMQLALSVQYSEECGGLGGSVIYICTEEAFSSKRFFQMIEKSSRKHNSEIKFSNNLYLLHLADCTALKNNFEKIESLVRQRNIKLLVLDSVTALFRGNVEYKGRQKAQNLRMISRTLYKLNGTYGVMIVCVNQVSSCLKTQKECVPALGLAWANLITRRIRLNRSELRRTLEVIFSPEFPQMKVPFQINECGVL